uniref:Uncharacterized protein n=1 Tax=Manihot esculenta TaxID=3983 RepID=A0A199U930_MANES
MPSVAKAKKDATCLTPFAAYGSGYVRVVLAGYFLLSPIRTFY